MSTKAGASPWLTGIQIVFWAIMVALSAYSEFVLGPKFTSEMKVFAYDSHGPFLRGAMVGLAVGSSFFLVQQLWTTLKTRSEAKAQSTTA